MENKNFQFGDSEWDLLVKILERENEMFDRMQQILLALSGPGSGNNVDLVAINGVAPSVGCGVSTTGTLRVAQATDCVVTTSNNNGAGAAAVNIQDGGNSITVDGTVSLGAGAATIGSLTANQSVNVAQIAGTTTLVGNGVTGAGSQRVTIASDQTAFSVNSTTTSVVPGTGATNLGKAEDSVAASGDVGVFALGVANEAQTVLAADGDYIAHVTDTKGNHLVVGNLAHDAVDAGFPVKIGKKAIAFGSNPTAVAAADRTDLYANRAGVPFVLGGHPNIITIEAAYTAAQTDTAIVTIAAGLKIVVTCASVLCANANTVDVGFRVGFGTANTPTTTGVVLTHPGVAPGSGFTRGSGSGILGVGADNEDLRITSDVPTGGSVRVLISYHTIES